MKRKHRILWGLGCIAVAAATATMGFQSWRTAVMQRTSNRVLASAQSGLKVGKGAAALDMLDQARPAPDQLEAWQRTEVEAATAALKLDRLNAIYDQAPERILENENAALLVYRSLVVQGRPDAAATVMAVWSGKSTRPATWTVHQVDALIGQRQGAKARKLLETASGWAPADELQRQLRPPS